MREVVRAAREVGLRALTLYAFSAQNWQRPPDEVATLMQLLRDYLIEERAEIMDNDIRLIAIGDVERLPDFVRDPLDALMRDSAGEPGDDPVPGAVVRRARVDRRRRPGRCASWRPAGRSSPRTSPRSGSRRRCRPAGMPQLDLLIRTSGEERLSNFLLWEAAYAELYFTDTFWPDFGKEEFSSALESYRGRERRFGRTREQIRSARLTRGGRRRGRRVERNLVLRVAVGGRGAAAGGGCWSSGGEPLGFGVLVLVVAALGAARIRGA